MSITSYAKNCTAKRAGNSNKLFLAKISQIDDITVVANEVTDIAMDSITEFFAEVNADLHSVSYTSEGQGSTGYFSTQNLIAKFSKKTPTLEATLNELIDGVVCGLVAIRIDNNRQAWLSGIAEATTDGKSLPWNNITDSYTSGESIEDFEEGDMYTVTLTRTAGVKEIKLDDSLTTALLDGSSTLVSWIV